MAGDCKVSNEFSMYLVLFKAPWFKDCFCQEQDCLAAFFHAFTVIVFCISGVDTDELDSNVDDWEEETVEFFINEEIITLAEPE